METSEKKWPCVECTEQEYEQIREQLHELGFTDKEYFHIDKEWDVSHILQTRYDKDDARIIGNYLQLDHDDQYLCPDIDTFLHDAREVAIREGWFKETQPEEMKWKARCPTRELPKRLQRLVEFRRTEGTPENNVSFAFCWGGTPEGFDFWFNVDKGVVPANLEKVLDKFEKEHPELLDVEKVEEETATEKVEETHSEQYDTEEVKEEQQNSWQAELWPCVRCTKDEFEQQIFRELAALGYAIDFAWYDSDNMVVTNFDGIGGKVDSVKESFVNSVIHHRNFCKTIPEFIEAAKELAIRKGWFKPEPSTPTLAEARKQFRELTKHYTVEQLSAPELPRSWAEYLEQNPIADTTEMDKKLEALRKLRLMRDKWVEGWHYSAHDGCWAIRYVHGFGGHVDYLANSRLAALSFPTKEMAEKFGNVFNALINEAEDLI